MQLILNLYAQIKYICSIIICILINGRYLRTIFSITILKPDGNSKIVDFYTAYYIYIISFGPN